MEARPRQGQEQFGLFLLNTLASYYIESSKDLAREIDGQSQADSVLKEATSLVNQAERINRQDPLTLTNKGNNYLI